jgi:hypothetical protein
MFKLYCRLYPIPTGLIDDLRSLFWHHTQSLNDTYKYPEFRKRLLTINAILSIRDQQKHLLVVYF